MKQWLQGYKKSTWDLTKTSICQNWIYMERLLHFLSSSSLSDCTTRPKEDTVEINSWFICTADRSYPVLLQKRVTDGECFLPFQFVQGVRNFGYDGDAKFFAHGHNILVTDPSKRLRVLFKRQVCSSPFLVK